MKIINFRGDLTDNSAKKEALKVHILRRVACTIQQRDWVLQTVKDSNSMSDEVEARGV